MMPVLLIINCRYEKGGERREKAGFTFLNHFERTNGKSLAGQQNVNTGYFKKTRFDTVSGPFFCRDLSSEILLCGNRQMLQILNEFAPLAHMGNFKTIFIKQIHGLPV